MTAVRSARPGSVALAALVAFVLAFSFPSVASAVPNPRVYVYDAASRVGSGIDRMLSTTTGITGIVSQEIEGGGTAPLANAFVALTRLDGGGSTYTHTDADGRYLLLSGLLGQGESVLTFKPPAGSNLASEAWPDQYDPSQATPLTVAQGQLLSGMDAVLARGASITGRIRYDLGVEQNLEGAAVQFYREGDAGFEWWALDTTGADGTFARSQLPAGNYILRFHDSSGKNLGVRYWPNAKFLDTATVITVEAGEIRALGDIVLVARDVGFQRLAGPDRFATGVAITLEQFKPGDPVPVIYIANGLNYPDALTAGPAAIANGGGLLLVRPGAIPAVVASELERLHPHRIVVVGGTSAVSEAVRIQLENYTDNPVERIGGADRYETSRLVVLDAFSESGAVSAFFATGRNYPDALAAGPAAGYRSSPVILVDGNASRLDSATGQLMLSLGVTNATVVGGYGAVSEGIENSIREYLVGSWWTQRLMGDDRYSTAAAVNNATFGQNDRAFIATGMGFADALSGGPLAGSRGEPLYLSPPGCVPAVVVAQLAVKEVNEVWLLGGTGILSNAVAQLRKCP